MFFPPTQIQALEIVFTEIPMRRMPRNMTSCGNMTLTFDNDDKIYILNDTFHFIHYLLHRSPPAQASCHQETLIQYTITPYPPIKALVLVEFQRSAFGLLQVT